MRGALGKGPLCEVDGVRESAGDDWRGSEYPNMTSSHWEGLPCGSGESSCPPRCVGSGCEPATGVASEVATRLEDSGGCNTELHESFFGGLGGRGGGGPRTIDSRLF